MTREQKLHIATDLSLPLRAVTEALGFLGRRGSGKTYAAQKLAEEFHRVGAQFVVLDVVGNWYALRLASDGVSPGIPIPVFGGLHGDVPLEPTAGKLIADLIVDRGISAVIDLSQFESDAAKARFAADFGDRFYFRKKSAPSAVHVFLEESQEIIPQNPQGDETRMLHVWARMAKLGRNYGIGISMLSQRPQEVNKKVLNLTELLFCFQLTGPQERKTVDGWIRDKGIDEDIGAELPKLKRGQPHAWSPSWLEISRVVSIADKWTFDASATPEVGARAVESKPLTPIDLGKLREDMAATIEKAKADDPKLLKARVAELERELRAAPISTPAIDAETIRRAEVEAYRKGRSEAERELERALSKTALRVDAVWSQLRTIVDEVGDSADHLDRLRKELTEKPQLPAPAYVATTPVPTLAPRSVQPVAPAPVRRDNGTNNPADTGLGKTPQKMLDAMAFLESIGFSPATREAVAGLCGISASTGTFRNYLTALRTPGYMQDVGDSQMQITDAGRRGARMLDIRSLGQLHDIWRSKLGSTQRRMLDVLIVAGPNVPVSRAYLATAVGIDPTTGTFRNYLTDLRTPRIMRDIDKAHVAATDLLFPPGIPR